MNVNTQRIIGTNGMLQRIHFDGTQTQTVAATLTTLRTIVLPRFAFDEDGRELWIIFRCLGLGAAGTKTFRMTTNAHVSLNMAGITVSNQGAIIQMYLTRQNFNQLIAQGFHPVALGFGGFGSGASPQTMEQHTVVQTEWANEITLVFQAQCANAADTVQCFVSQVYKL